MAIHILSTRKDTTTDNSIIEFQCDAEADVANLPTQARSSKGVCATGSTAYVIDPESGKSPNRRLSSEEIWEEAPMRTPGVDIVIDCGTPATH